MRVADPSCNPYLALLLLLKAAENGIERNLKLSAIKEGEELSDSLMEAAQEAESSKLIEDVLPPHLLKCFLEAKRNDYRRAERAPEPVLFSRDLEFLVT